MENNEKSIVLAFDLGASSGRAVVGILRDSKLELKNLYRFPNSGIRVSNSYCWDTIRIYQEMLHSMHLFVKEHGTKLDSLALDSWGVDYVLLNEYDELAGPVYYYRDKRTEGMLEQMFKKIPKEEIYKTTGIQFMSLNTSSQLYSMVVNKSPQLSITRYFLMIPDYFNFLFTGRKTSEFSIASTSQLYDPVKKDWANGLIKKLGLNPNWFPEIVQPGTFVGFLNEDIRNDCGLEKGTRIIAPLCHDTGSAVVAVPVDTSKYKEKEWAYISSGTWSLLGVELEKPLINEKALTYNYTNEGGINQTFRFLKNITGMWLIQECKRIWEIDSPSLEWDDIVSLTEKSNEFQYFIDINDSRFNNPTNMITELQDYCKETNQVF